jgi:hypothetical protein
LVVVVLVAKYVNVNFQNKIIFPKNQTMRFRGYYPRSKLWMSNLGLQPPAFINDLFNTTIATILYGPILYNLSSS